MKMLEITEEKLMLKEGNTDDDVIILSSMLKIIDEYYFGVSDIRISSYFNKELTKAVRKARKIFSLPDTGVVDEELLTRLDEEVRAIRTKKKHGM